MVKTAWKYGTLFIVSASLIVLSGCGGGDSSGGSSTGNAKEPGQSEESQTTGTGQGTKLPTASIASAKSAESSKDEADEAVAISNPEPGSAEWLNREIIKVRIRPVPKTANLDELRADRQARNVEIIELATKAIGVTHDKTSDPQQERLFTVAVHHLVEARFQLAIQGDEESIDALYEHADSLYKRDPKSEAAMDAAYTVARFANTNAQRFGSQEPRWLQEFARQARRFAANFPQPEYQQRGISLLMTAGQSCEFRGLREEAIACYGDLKTLFPESPQGQQAVAMLRRLELEGKPLELAGPTIEGGFVNVDQYQGNLVLVVFWSTDAEQFLEDVGQIRALQEKYAGKGFRVIGVNLNEHEPDIDAFLEQAALDWPQIFHADPTRRGMNNPVAVYYGVRRVPTYWLVASDGTVANVGLKAEDIEEKLLPLLSETPASKPTPSE